MAVLNGTISDFLNVFTQIKNVDFKETEGLDELHRLHIDEQEFVELRSMAHFAGSVAGGAVAGTAGGALAAFGAYGAAQALAFASTGTAISALSGAAATNATLAFFGGGSLAAGGLGMAGGTAVLGGLVAGPALLVMGLVAGKAAKKGLEKHTPTELRQCRSQRSSTRHPYNVRPSAEEPVCFTICWLDWILTLCR